MNLTSALICLILENVIPKGGQSSNAQGGLNEVKKFLTPKDDLSGRPDYARLLNQNRVIRFYLRRKDGLTSSCAPGGRFFPGRSEACLTTLFSEFCHLKI